MCVWGFHERSRAVAPAGLIRLVKRSAQRAVIENPAQPATSYNLRQIKPCSGSLIYTGSSEAILFSDTQRSPDQGTESVPGLCSAFRRYKFTASACFLFRRKRSAFNENTKEG